MADLDDLDTGIMSTPVDFDPSTAIQTLEDLIALIDELDTACKITWNMKQAARAQEICLKGTQLVHQYKTAIIHAPHEWNPGTPPIGWVHPDTRVMQPEFPIDGVAVPSHLQTSSTTFSDPENGDVPLMEVDPIGT